MISFPRLGESDRGGAQAARWGGKGAWLHWLLARGLPVPPCFVIPSDLVQGVVDGVHLEVLAAALSQLRAAPGAPPSTAGATAPRLAVRSSALTSQPGLLPTRIALETDADVLAAVAEIQEAGRRHGVPTAVVVQHSIAAGAQGFAAAAFTRDPTTGTRGVVGEFSPGGLGADVVGGRRSLPRISRGPGALREARPQAYDTLTEFAETVEAETGRIMELELIEDGQRLWVLQVRPVARRPRAACRLALERLQLDPKAHIDLRYEDGASLVEERVALSGASPPAASGLAASPGLGEGAAVFSAEDALRRSAAGEQVVLLRPHAIPGDVPAIGASRALVTTTGGLTCHAAVMARGLGRPAVVGCAELEVGKGGANLAGVPIVEGELLTVDGYSGGVHRGRPSRETVPAGVDLPDLLRRLAGRRESELWLRQKPGSAPCARFFPDAWLAEAPPSPDDGDDNHDGNHDGVLGSEFSWALDALGTIASKTVPDSELLSLPCVNQGQWKPNEQVSCVVLASPGIVPAALPTRPERVAAYPGDFVPWAFALDPRLVGRDDSAPR